ncbi:MAG TPA: hypothetical protein VH374_16855 [Polyangia bacterium]|jgi:hypothetical protein|nr:hypothetical protein [Polyangia bacterium]
MGPNYRSAAAGQTAAAHDEDLLLGKRVPIAGHSSLPDLWGLQTLAVTRVANQRGNKETLADKVTFTFVHNYVGPSGVFRGKGCLLGC